MKKSEDRNRAFFEIAASSSLFGALVSTAIAVFALVLTHPPQGTLSDYLGDVIAWIGAVTVPSGAILGFLGGIWLGVVGQGGCNRIAMTAHGALTGAALSAGLAGILVLIDPAGRGLGHMKFVIFTCSVGTACGGLYAIAFGRLLLRSDQIETNQTQR